MFLFSDCFWVERKWLVTSIYILPGTWRLEVDTGVRWLCPLWQDSGRCSCAGLIYRPLSVIKDRCLSWTQGLGWWVQTVRDEELWVCDLVENGPRSWCVALKPTIRFVSSAYPRFMSLAVGFLYGCHLLEMLIFPTGRGRSESRHFRKSAVTLNSEQTEPGTSQALWPPNLYPAMDCSLSTSGLSPHQGWFKSGSLGR